MAHQHQAAIVTGSSRGIGAAIAERLARDGVAVVDYPGDAAPANELAVGIVANGGRAMACKVDVADAISVADSDDALVDRHLAINLKGTIKTLREAARRLRDGGRVVNLSSSGFGALAVRALALAGDTVFALKKLVTGVVPITPPLTAVLSQMKEITS